MASRMPWRAPRLALALLAPAALLGLAALPALPAEAAASCSVPCGYVYPRLLFDLGERGVPYELTSGQPIHLEGTLTFTWDITSEGMALPNPTTPIVVSFTYPRKPAWLDVEVTPERLDIPISPQYMEQSTANGALVLVYRYTAPIAVDARLTDVPVVDPAQPPTLLILAQSTESGLYKPGFGVRDLPLGLPEALVQTAGPAETAPLRIGDVAPAEVQVDPVTFGDATLTLETDGPVAPWKESLLTARVALAGGLPSAGLDLSATVVDEAGRILYASGLRHRPDGTLAFPFTFPGPGHHRVLLAARAPAAASGAAFEPLVAAFPMVLPSGDFDALRYPDAYRARYQEPVADVHANPADPPRQFEKVFPFPVLAGAASASVQVLLASNVGAALGPGSVYAEVLGPQDEQLAYGKLDAVTPGMDARLHGPLPGGAYRLRVYGLGANALGLAGTEIQASLGVFYNEAPVAPVRTTGQPLPRNAGGNLSLGTGGMEAELILHDAPSLWAPLHATVLVKDPEGRVALHPDVILTVRGPDGAGDPQAILYTTGHRHPHDGLLHWGMALPAPGLYTVSAYAAPTPEASGAFWQPATVSWPLRIDPPADGRVRYPATYEARYHDAASSVALGGVPGGYAFAKSYPVPVKEGATALAAELALMTMAMVHTAEGAAPAKLAVEILDPAGAVLARTEALPTGGARVEATDLQPGLHRIRVTGLAYAPLDYSGAMYNLTVTATYPEGPVETFPVAGAPPPAEPSRAVPGPGLLGLALAAGAGAFALRRRRGVR